MTAGKYNLTIEQGATFRLVLTYKDSANNLINLTGFTARLHVRRNIGDSSTMLSLTTENGGISLGGAAGTIFLFASDSTTSALSGTGFYDLEIISGGGEVTRVIEGRVNISENVTR